MTGIDISERGIEQARLLGAEAHPFAWVFDDDDAATELRLHHAEAHPFAARLPLLFSLKATKA